MSSWKKKAKEQGERQRRLKERRCWLFTAASWTLGELCPWSGLGWESGMHISWHVGGCKLLFVSSDLKLIHLFPSDLKSSGDGRVKRDVASVAGLQRWQERGVRWGWDRAAGCSLPGGAGGPRWTGRPRGAHRRPRSQPSPARNRCRTPGRWSPRRRTSRHSFGGVCGGSRARRPKFSACGAGLVRSPEEGTGQRGVRGRESEAGGAGPLLPLGQKK